MDIDWDENSRLEESPGKPAAPSSSNSSQVTTKNWRAEVDGITKQPPKGPQIASSDSSFYEAMKNSSLLESPKTKERIRDAARLQQRNTMSMSITSGGGCGGNSSSGDNYSEHEQEDGLALVDASLPDDLAKELEAEQLVLDCKRIGTPKRKNHSAASVSSKRSLNGSSSSGIPRKTQGWLSNKTGNFPCSKPGVESRRAAPPPVAPKPANLIGAAGSRRLPTPTKSARVSPFNYRQPVETTETTAAKMEEKKKSPKSATTISKERLFVTTV
uniref:Uncharacterized protein n=1 Tax=Ditylenchus dipsaci TaxID=166011 RepID=A0A915EN27_9BILA